MKKRGFTLIEVLIVVAIIAILVTFLVPNFMGVRIRARDARKKSDLSQIQKGLELYKSDQDPPSYPATGFFNSSLCQQCWSSEGNCQGNIYLHKVPCDPQNPLNSPYYFTIDSNDDLKYTLTACLENAQDIDRDGTATDECANLNKESYTITEP